MMVGTWADQGSLHEKSNVRSRNQKVNKVFGQRRKRKCSSCSKKWHAQISRNRKAKIVLGKI